jgi:hypothetical protein
MSDRFAELKGYEIAGCAAFDRNLISFWGQQWDEADTLEPRPTAVFFYYADEPSIDRWAYSGIADATGIHGCAAHLPTRQWVYVLDDGEVYVVGSGADDFERPIASKKGVLFSNVKCIRSGHAYAVGPHRKVFVRQKPSRWVQLHRGLSSLGKPAQLENIGFLDIDGFSETELYACGGHGDLWLYENGAWRQLDPGTNAVLMRICCASDGYVYLTTNRREILCGRHDSWQIIQQDVTGKVLESIVDFMGHILISTETELLEVIGGRLAHSTFTDIPAMRSKAHLAAADDVLVVAGKDEAVMFDGTAWTSILSAEP